MKNYKAVIFDLDGTLANTLQDITDSVNYALSKFNMPAKTTEEVCATIGRGTRQMLSNCMPEDRQHLVIDAHKAQDQYYKEHLCDNTVPYPGIIEMLNKLKSNQIKLAVHSNKPSPYTEMVVDALFGDRYFQIVRGHNSDFPLKPDPASVLFMSEKLCVKPEDTVFVGDSDVDMQTAVNASMFAAGVTWGFRDRDQLLASGCQMLIDDPKQICSLVSG